MASRFALLQNSAIEWTRRYRMRRMQFERAVAVEDVHDANYRFWQASVCAGYAREALEYARNEPAPRLP
jgi:hypothetical protein